MKTEFVITTTWTPRDVKKPIKVDTHRSYFEGDTVEEARKEAQVYAERCLECFFNDNPEAREDAHSIKVELVSEANVVPASQGWIKGIVTEIPRTSERSTYIPAAGDLVDIEILVHTSIRDEDFCLVEVSSRKVNEDNPEDVFIDHSDEYSITADRDNGVITYRHLSGADRKKAIRYLGSLMRLMWEDSTDLQLEEDKELAIRSITDIIHSNL